MTPPPATPSPAACSASSSSPSSSSITAPAAAAAPASAANPSPLSCGHPLQTTSGSGWGNFIYRVRQPLVDVFVELLVLAVRGCSQIHSILRHRHDHRATRRRLDMTDRV